MSNAEFNKNFQALIAKRKEQVNEIVRAVALELLSGVTLRSPVDTGRFRANWQANIGSPDLSTTDATSRDGALSAANRSVIEAFRAGQKIFLTNSLPYAAVLEFGGYPNPPKGGEGKTSGGYSIQAPAGMVRVTVAEYGQYLRQVVEAL